jgi:FkbM family methyltransferase
MTGFEPDFAPIPTWVRLLRFYSQISPVSRGKLRLAKWFFNRLTFPEQPVRAEIAPGIFAAFDLRLWNDFASCAVGGPEPLTLAYFHSSLHPHDQVFDIGAYIGLYALTASHIVTGGQVHAFEPNPNSAERLQHAITTNKLTNIKFSQCAVGDRLGVVQFGLDKIPVMSRMTEVDHPAGVVEVPVDTIDAYCQRNNVKQVQVVKIDVEGAELLVLRGGQRLFEDVRPLIIIELHPVRSKLFGYQVSDTVQFLLDRGYHLSLIGSTMSGRPRLLPFMATPEKRQIVLALPD